jgi:hypothetical protein
MKPTRVLQIFVWLLVLSNAGITAYTQHYNLYWPLFFTAIGILTLVAIALAACVALIIMGLMLLNFMFNGKFEMPEL